MCGICGALAIKGSSIVSGEVENVQKLLFLNSFRGLDSTGLFDYVANPPKVTKSRNKKLNASNIHYWKKMLPAYEFALDEMTRIRHDNKERWSNGNLKLLVGHARSATVGQVKLKNAHPFVHGNVIGVHNGTIHSSFEGSKSFETDSEALIWNISQVGIENTIKETLKENSSAAYALVWVDTKEEELNIIRNSMRPLHWVEKSSVVYFSSEAKDLSYALSVDRAEIKPFVADTLYTIPLASDGKFREKRIVRPTPTYTYTGSSNSVIPHHWNRETLSDESVYETSWKNDSLASWVQRGQKSMNNNPYMTNFDYGFGAYFYDYHYKMLKLWKKDHKKEYDDYFTERWSKLSREEKDAEKAILQGIFKPVPKPEPEKEHLTIPFGVAGRKCSEAAYEQKVKAGCSYCSASISKFADVCWVSEDDFFCEDCVKDAIDDPKHLINDMVSQMTLRNFIEQDKLWIG